jgi:hypothetical protein
MTRTDYAVATRDELWLHGRLAERRLSHGEAHQTGDGIVATDARDDALVASCEAAMEELRRCVSPEFRMRLVAEARLDGVTSTITLSRGGFSVVTEPAHIEEDAELLRRAVLPPETDARKLPLLWRNGSAAVLLHEAAGHPAEHGQLTPLPEWLHVDNPLALRRASFRDVPLLRMTNLVATQTNAPFELPDERIEVLLVDGGAYDPLTETITLRIAAADLVTRNRTQRVAPFAIRESRTSLSFLGATGDPIRYPGVICSREAQELVVGSHAPLMVTA